MEIVFSAFWIIVGIVWFIYHLIKDYDLTPRNIKRAIKMEMGSSRDDRIVWCLFHLSPLVLFLLGLIAPAIGGVVGIVIAVLEAAIGIGFLIFLLCLELEVRIDRWLKEGKGDTSEKKGNDESY